MARRRPGRPKNLIPTQQISVLLPVPLIREITRLARAQGLGIGTWMRQCAIEAVDRTA